MKYNKISQLGIINGDRVRLIQVKFTVNIGTEFWEFKKMSVYLIEGDRLIEVKFPVNIGTDFWEFEEVSVS